MRLFLLIIFFIFSKFSFAQSIIVNNEHVNVYSDISFPFWLDSMSTIQIGSNVVSISVLEFNINPITNGNSLVFNQIKNITNQEIVPEGKTWKIASVLLDTNSIVSSTYQGLLTIQNYKNKPIALSSESTTELTMGSAMIYCDTLSEGNYDNWVVPTLEELLYVASGGGTLEGERTTNQLITRQPANAGGYTQTWSNPKNYYSVSLQTGTISLLNSEQSDNTMHVRCVRYGSELSSNTSSTINSNSMEIPKSISSVGVYSPDTLKYWKIESINLKNKNTSFSFPLVYDSFGTFGSPPQWTCNYLPEEQIIIKFGDINYSITPTNTKVTLGPVQYSNYTAEDCDASADFTFTFNDNTFFQDINLPIYLNSSDTIEIYVDGLVINLLEY